MLASFFFSAASTLVLLTTSVNGLPASSRQAPAYTPASDLSNLATLFPSSSLPPPTNLVLKYVALGVGTQNYTCSTGNSSAAPGTTGAKATLYDIGSKLNSDPLAKWKLDSISPIALSTSLDPSLLSFALQSQGYQHIIGHHFFSNATGTNTPHFALDGLAQPYPEAIVTKTAETPAPADACPGENLLPAITWLLLQDKAGVSRGSINTVYRVETAGGNKPTTCENQPAHFEVKYAAQYWIYGPKS